MAQQTGFSSSLFWAKHIGMALALVIVAGIIINLNIENESKPKPEGAQEEKSVSKGLSDFYREFRMSSTDPIKDEVGDFVLELSEQDQPLDSQLEKMSSDIKPISSRWVGEHKYRTFKAGNTLREAISSYAQQEGMQVIWDLDQDFVIKHQFQMDNTIVGSLKKIASAIDSSFEGEVVTYVCPKQRSLVVTDENTDYLKRNCNLVRS